MFYHLESAILISPIARFDFDNSRSTRENRLYLECSIYIRYLKNSFIKYLDSFKFIQFLSKIIGIALKNKILLENILNVAIFIT